MQSKSVQTVVKRGIDLLVSVPGLVVLAPLFVLTAIAIRLDSAGPALFTQDRLGKAAKGFRIYKFRTMVDGAPDGAVRAGTEDPRVTRVGGLLRKWSLDELPQLFNVLKGDMSLVGPRPDRTFRLREYTEHQRRRLEVKPGITGLAQVSGRNAILWERRYELDVAYVDSWSLKLDLQILFQTIGVVLGQRGIDFEQAEDT